MKTNLQFIHVGKCGGMTIRNMLKSQSILFFAIHVQAPMLDSQFKSIIPIRNPVERFCSAFYWRKKKTSHNQKLRFNGEKNFLDKHKDINSLIDNLEELQTNYVHHIGEVYHWYLANYLKVLTPQLLKGLVFTNSIKEDLGKMYGKEFDDLWDNKGTSEYELTSKEREKLKEHLALDYKTLEQLFNKVSINNNKTKDILK